ncbi:omega-6 fatty acid desaturase, chloroplastic-like [Malania oleifera]|uniref:omega-6 fatty acid desaturase, chloroplastic-like n=1 Tax=Malania oleifera TaxID=397392 RepID=UPI0025AE43DB|nr:omega-6 fatty acid desaturase, chloroplastic-like [Malania oleifera]
MGCRCVADPAGYGISMVISTTSLSLSQYPYQRATQIRPSRQRRLHSSSMHHLKRESLLQRGNKQQQHLVPVKRTKIVKAVAVPPTASSIDGIEYRKHLAKSYGFAQIAEPIPETVTLKDIADTLPKKLLEIDDAKAWKAVLKSVAFYALGLFMTSKTPWYLLPLAWAWTGTAAAGFFSIGHECGHKSFFRNKLVEDIVGTLAFLPLIYPYEAWRFEHERHHAKTNMLFEDTGWHPIPKEYLESSPLVRKAMIYGYGLLRPWMTIAHWLQWHFDVNQFRPNEMKRVKISLACVYAFIAVGWPFLIYETGFTGWINFWLMPWLVYHFWMSVVTMIHHTAPHISFKPRDEWNAAEAQLSGTIHCDYPSWVEFFIHDINFHVPHHISPRIPFYNLRAAHQLLRDHWGKYLNETTWSWRLMKTIMTTCHVYSEEKNYSTFDELAPQDSRSITFLRKVMPE